VTSRQRVDVGSHREDQPRTVLLVPLALLTLGLGVWLGARLVAPTTGEPTKATSDPQAVAHTAPQAEGRDASAPAPSVAHAREAATRDAGAARALATTDASAAAEAVATAQPQPDVVDAPRAVADAPVPELEADLPAATHGRRALLPGRVAYLRCDGLATRNARYPCPRDRAFERAVWHALGGLRDCAAVAEGPLELRVEIARGARPSFEMRGPDDARGQARAASACTAEALAPLQSALVPIRMVVSFSFELAAQQAPRR